MKIFLRLSSEKELVQQLIMTHLEFTRFKKQAIDSEDYEEKCDEYIDKTQEIKRQLRSRLSKEIVKDTMNNIQAILTDCEELVRDELELEEKLNQKSHSIENHKKIALQITDNSEIQRIIGLEKQTNQQQIQLAKEVRTINIFVNNSSNNANNMNDNSATYHNSQHNEHNQSQFYQQVPPKNQ